MEVAIFTTPVQALHIMTATSLIFLGGMCTPNPVKISSYLSFALRLEILKTSPCISTTSGFRIFTRAGLSHSSALVAQILCTRTARSTIGATYSSY